MLAWMHAAILAWSMTAAPAPVMPPPEPMPSPEQILAVPPALREQLQRQVIGDGGPARQRMQRLVEFLFDPSGLGMTYATDATLTVAQAYRQRKANCLTFTLLTVALAREAGLDAHAQEIDDVVAWHVQDNVVYLSDDTKASGFLEYERARVRWFLSVDIEDVPAPLREAGQRTYRSITVDGEEIEFSGGFTDLHDRSYAEILAGRGFGLEDNRTAIETVAAIRTGKVDASAGNAHPFLRKK